MKTVWTLLFVTGYTSEATVEVFEKEEDCKEAFKKTLRDTFSHEDLSIEDVLEIVDGERDHFDNADDLSIYPSDVSWDSGEVWRRVTYFETEIK